MGERLNTIAGPGWEDIPEQEAEPVKPAEKPEPPEQEEKPKTEEEIKAETFQIRRGATSQFLEGLKNSRSEDLEKEREKLKKLSKGKLKISKERRIGFLETEIQNMKNVLKALNEQGDINPGIDFIEEVISEHSASFKEGHVRSFSSIDERIFKYINSTIEGISNKVKMGVVLSEHEMKIFEDYSKIVKEKTNKKSEADILKEKIEALRTQIAAQKPAKPEKPNTEEKAEKSSTEKPERPGYDFLILGTEKYEKGNKIIYKTGKKSVNGVITNFKRDKEGKITGVIIQKEGVKEPRKKPLLVKEFAEWQGVVEPETIAATAPEAETVVVETEKPEEAPEFNENEYVSGTTLKLLELSEKKIEAKDAPGILRILSKKREEIEIQLSGDIDVETKKELLERKRQVCAGIIEAESERQGEDLLEKLKEEEQKQLNIYINTSGFGSRKKYEENFRNKYYESVILKSTLPEKQKTELAKHNELTTQWSHNFFARPFLAVNLNKLEIATLIDAGINIEEIGWANGDKFPQLLTKIQVEAQKMTKNEFEAFVLEKYNLLEKKIKEAIEKREEEIVDKGGIRDFVITEKANEIIDGLPDESPDVAPEFPENPDEAHGLKIETPDERLDKLNQLRYGWLQANRLSQALRENKKINIGGGEILNPKNEEERKKIEEEMSVFSEEIIRVANEISGRSLRREFWQNKFKEGEIVAEKPTDFEKEAFRNKLRGWLTKETQEIYKKSMEELKEQAKVSGKKVALKDTRSPEKVFKELGKNLPNEKEYVGKNLEEEKKDVAEKYMREFLHKTNFSADVLRYLTDNQNVITEDALAFALESGYDIEELRNAMVSRKWIIAGKGKVKIGKKSVDQKELQKQFEDAKKKFSRRVLSEATKRLKFDYSTGNLKK